MNRTLVEEVMTSPVVTAGVTMPVRHLMALLYASGIGAEHVEGMIAVRDRFVYPARSAPSFPSDPGL